MKINQSYKQFRKILNSIPLRDINLSTVDPVFWRGITYGQGLFVAIAGEGSSNTGNRISTSPDGITWTARTVPTTGFNVPLNNVFFAKNLFIAFGGSGGGGGIIYSYDGISWYVAGTGTAGVHTCASYGNGVFVVANSGGGASSYYYSSPDGLTWTARTGIIPINAICFGNGKFVSVGGNNGTANIAYSTDGITWMPAFKGSGISYKSVCFSGGYFVAVSLDGKVIQSIDGIEWSEPVETGLTNVTSISYGVEQFMITSTDSQLHFSDDGFNWKKNVIPWSGQFRSSCYGKGKFLAVASTGLNRIVSTGQLYE